jgi:hypothetical protein
MISGTTVTLEWTANGQRKQILISTGDMVVSPDGLFVAPRWEAEVELILLGVPLPPGLFTGGPRCLNPMS